MLSKEKSTKKKGSKKVRKDADESRLVEDKFLVILSELVKKTYPSQKLLHKNKRRHRSLSAKLTRTNDLNITYQLLKNHLFKDNTLVVYPDIVIINQIIKKLAIANHLPLAMQFYQLALDNQFASIVTFNTLIDIAGKQGQLETTREVFEKAKVLGKTDYTCYHIFINALVQNNHFEEAKEVYLNSPLSMARKGKCYDLHGFSFGSTQVAVDLLLSNTKKQTRFTFITGKGIHSSNRRKYQVKTALTKLLNDKKISYRVSPHNSGELMINYTPVKMNQHTRSGLNNHGVNFFRPANKLTPSNTTKTWAEIAS